jgi:1,4-alpha-glucan branching enzyme
VVAFRRIARDPSDFVIVVAHYTPLVRRGYRIGVPPGAVAYRELLNTDAARYGGSGVGQPEAIPVDPVAAHGQQQSIELTLPPLGVVFLAPVGAAG